MKIVSVALKLKFKCKMRIDYKDSHLTREVESRDYVYLIEE